MDSQNTMTNVMNASFNLMRRLPPKAVPKNLGAIMQLINDEDLKYDIQQKTDQPIGKYINAQQLIMKFI